jgi:hypothetical protein
MNFSNLCPTRLLATAAIVLLTPLASAQTPKAFPAADSLRGITTRGIALARYDASAWHASDAVMALHPSEGEIRGYVALETAAGWIVAFGRLTPARDTFLVAYEAQQVSAALPDSFVVRAMRPARADTGDYARAARAIELARGDFGTLSRQYNFAALRAARGEWFVYAMPAQTRADVWPLGGDRRYLIAADGRTIVGKRQLHNAILERGASRGPDGKPPVAGTHAAVLDDVPEDTDVFHVLVREPGIPEYIVTNAFLYRVDPDGTIRMMGRREDVLGR